MSLTVNELFGQYLIWHCCVRLIENRPYYGLYICPMMWREIDNFSSGSVCMVLASDFYNEADYFRDFGDFRQTALAQR